MMEIYTGIDDLFIQKENFLLFFLFSERRRRNFLSIEVGGEFTNSFSLLAFGWEMI